MRKLPNNTKKDMDELMLILAFMTIAACMAGSIASRYVYSKIRVIHPAKGVWIYQTPVIETTKPHKEKVPVKNDTIAEVIETLCKIESDFRTDAIGDGGLAVGILQIWPIMVREASRISGIPFTLADRFSPSKSREMAWAVLSHYQKVKRIEDPIQLAGLWNRPDGKAPARYLNKFESEWVRRTEKGE